MRKLRSDHNPDPVSAGSLSLDSVSLQCKKEATPTGARFHTSTRPSRAANRDHGSAPISPGRAVNERPRVEFGQTFGALRGSPRVFRCPRSTGSLQPSRDSRPCTSAFTTVAHRCRRCRPEEASTKPQARAFRITHHHSTSRRSARSHSICRKCTSHHVTRLEGSRRWLSGAKPPEGGKHSGHRAGHAGSDARCQSLPATRRQKPVQQGRSNRRCRPCAGTRRSIRRGRHCGRPGTGSRTNRDA